jgi:phosphatidylglycerol:prolipoprotein diacylglycerol transferase
LGEVQPEIDLGPLTLQTFGLCFALAFLVGGALVWKRLGELGKPQDWAYEALFSALVGGLIGARLDYVIQNFDQVSGDLFGNVLTGSGLVWFGGLVGGTIAVVLWAWYRGFLGTTMLDVAAPALAIGYAVGRIGCQLAGDGDYGTAWDGPWAMAYPDGTVPTTDQVHPTPVYETLVMAGVGYLLWRLRFRLTGGLLFALYLLLAGLERFMVEFIRRNADVALGLTEAQLISLAMIIAGGTWLALGLGRPRGAELRQT